MHHILTRLYSASRGDSFAIYILYPILINPLIFVLCRLCIIPYKLYHTFDLIESSVVTSACILSMNILNCLFSSTVHPFMLDMTTEFPSVFSRAYHTHLSQHSSDFDPLTSSFSSSPTPSCTLPQFHPLLVRHADHPQQQVTARTNGGAANTAATNSGPNANSTGLSFENITPSAEAAVIAMQQVLTNIGSAVGGGGGGGEAGQGPSDTAGAQRTRGEIHTADFALLEVKLDLRTREEENYTCILHVYVHVYV